MRTCPKEKETVESCDGMNQKNMIFDWFGLKKAEKLEKLQKNKKEIKDLISLFRKKMIFLFKFLAIIGFFWLNEEKNFFHFQKSVTPLVFSLELLTS